MPIAKLEFNNELFYVLGALLGDGCIYHWGKEHQVWLVGDEAFTKKFADKLSFCIGRVVKNYPNRKRGYWFVKISNIKLYDLFGDIRNNLEKIGVLAEKSDKHVTSLLFVEGFFDAEGCVKIIKEKVRKTPKICLDITNTNHGLLEIIRGMLDSELGITANYSSQEAHLGKDGFYRKKIYHLRIYKKEYIRKFFENIHTTKLKKEKIGYAENWLKIKLSS
ncbi:MAG: LAGLIDADG family homing endonuclease [archaeon]